MLVYGGVAAGRLLLRGGVHLVRGQQEGQQVVPPAPPVSPHPRQRVKRVHDVL